MALNTPCLNKKTCHFYFLKNNFVQHWPILKNKLDVKEYILAHLTLIMSLHYLVKCRGRSLAVYNNEFVLKSACVGSKKITYTAKSLKTCYMFNTSRVYFKIVRRRTEITQRQRVSRSGSRVIERAAGESRQRSPIAFVLEGTF